MASKQYISVIRLFEHCRISSQEEINLPRVKKQLNAEFNLSGSGFIEVDGFSYSKQYVFEEIDRPDFTKQLLFHHQLWNSKPLLNVLEKNKVDLFEAEYAIRELQNEEGFEEFFSPYFALPFNIIMRNFLMQGQSRNAGEWLRFDGFLHPAEREEGFRSLRLFLEEQNRLLRNINADNYKAKKPELNFWLEPGGGYLLSMLPDEFYPEKIETVNNIINLTVQIQHNHRKDCRILSTEITCVTGLPQELQDLIINNHGIYNRQKFTSSSSGKTNYWWLLWILFFVIKGLAHC